MPVFTVLAFGLCAALLQHPPLPENFDDVVGIGQLKENGTQCDLFFQGNATGGDSISLNGHAVAIQRWDHGMAVSVDGTRFFVPRAGLKMPGRRGGVSRISGRAGTR
jgi:hypothetical protein